MQFHGHNLLPTSPLHSGFETWKHSEKLQLVSTLLGVVGCYDMNYMLLKVPQEFLAMTIHEQSSSFQKLIHIMPFLLMMFLVTSTL